MSDEFADLLAENRRLTEEVEALRKEIADLHFEADLDACHAAGLAAQIKALIAEGDACPNKAAHPLLERADYVDDRTGAPMKKTRAYPLYRAAFDEEANAAGIVDPEQYRG